MLFVSKNLSTMKKKISDNSNEEYEGSDHEIQLVVPEDYDESKNVEFLSLKSLPILPIKKLVLFPGLIIPLTLRHKKHIQLVKEVYQAESMVGVVAQKNSESNSNEITCDDVFTVGTAAKILKSIVFPDGNTTVIIQGRCRFKINEFISKSPNIVASIQTLIDNNKHINKNESKAIIHSIKEIASKILKMSPDVPSEVHSVLQEINNPTFLTYFLAANLNIDVVQKQKLLSIDDVIERAQLLLEYLLKALDFTKLKREIQTKVHTDINQHQKEQYIRYHIKALQEELGGGEMEEIDRLRSKAKRKKWSQETDKVFTKTLEKVERMSPNSPEYSVNINHAELLIELPWMEYSKDNLDITHAEKILNKDHFGLEKVKTRILEYLAVLKLRKDMNGPILCLYGPPGVGKTTLCKSIAKAINRKYAVISLGGVDDEGEIRGHRKTYIGAMPGKLISTIKKLEYSNPLIVLDEIDKIGGMRGDPASALLEVLDPEQNNSFVDNFLEVPYDLSKVFFISTANSLDPIPDALRDRMEMIEISGYTLEEKLQIAKQYLLPKQRKLHGIKASDVSIDDLAICNVIDNYTSESGVRELERKLGSIFRRIAKNIASEEIYKKKVTKNDINGILGMEIFDKDMYQKVSIPGVAIGLAWTPVGGEILFIETSLSKGKGQLTLSGQLGEVMKESAITALSYLKSHSDKLEIDYKLYSQYDLHVHIPAGAVPKDGPSAGITLFTALTSLYTQRKVKDGLAMTGEITLRGKVLPVGGIKEKILAAKRAGIKTIVMSNRNEKDIKEIHKQYLNDLEFCYVDEVDDVISHALYTEKFDGAKAWPTVDEVSVSN